MIIICGLFYIILVLGIGGGVVLSENLTALMAAYPRYETIIFYTIYVLKLILITMAFGLFELYSQEDSLYFYLGIVIGLFFALEITNHYLGCILKSYQLNSCNKLEVNTLGVRR